MKDLHSVTDVGEVMLGYASRILRREAWGQRSCTLSGAVEMGNKVMGERISMLLTFSRAADGRLVLSKRAPEWLV